MTIDWWTLGLQTVNVLILLWILAHFLFRPVSRMLAERQAAATGELEAAQKARAEAEAAREAARTEAQANAAKRAEVIAAANQEARSQKQALLDSAAAEVARTRAAAAAELAGAHRAQERALDAQASHLAADIAAKLLARLPENARVAGFIDGLAQAVADLPEATRQGIGTSGPVQIRAAHAPTGDETERLKRRLEEVLGHEVTLAIREDAGLIAGLELDAPHAIVRNHFRADLDRITAELISDD